MTTPNHPVMNARPRTIAGVIFDMDGVLVESEPFIAEAAVRMFAEKGVHVRPDDFRPFIGMGEDRFLGGVAEARGVVLDMPRDKDRTYEIYLELIPGRLEPLPGVAGFIGRCRGLGLKLAVASSADRVKVMGNLRELGLPPGTFDAVVVGEDILHKKPAPDIFLEASSPARPGAERLPGDRGRRFGSYCSKSRGLALPWADHVVFGRPAHGGGSGLDGRGSGDSPRRSPCLVIVSSPASLVSSPLMRLTSGACRSSVEA